MAKGIGLIGNFKGKVGNMVGYKLSDSNTGNSQGIRVYQPIVRNPKTSAQAEQRAKLAPINATYRALKMIIDRGNEGLPYGNKSRLAWLKKAFKPVTMPWYEKGAIIEMPVLCEITRGSLPSIANIDAGDSYPTIFVDAVTTAGTTKVGDLSAAIIASYPTLKDGDQLTFVGIYGNGSALNGRVASLVLDTTSQENIPAPFSVSDDALNAFVGQGTAAAAAIIVSREGANGEHLRSTETLAKLAGWNDAVESDTSKDAAIASYMNAAGGNTDWAEESIQ